MRTNAESSVAQLTAEIADGRRKPEELRPLVYSDLRRVAQKQLGQIAPGGNTLQPTALVHEAYLRLVGKDLTWHGAQHFFLVAARAIHDILVDHARQKAAKKRGGGRRRIDLDSLVISEGSGFEDILSLSEALIELEKRDARKHQIVMLRFFGGLSPRDCAATTGLSRRTVEREWRYARAWLHWRLSDPRGGDDGPRI
jgi:RNA polymerase sigma factor (TIGR02999 family)